MSSNRLARALALVLVTAAPAYAVSPDHHEFDAMLEAPYTATGQGEARNFTLRFSYPDAVDPQTVAWRLELLGRDGLPVRLWYGEERFVGVPFEVSVPWDGRGRGKAGLADGHYQVRLTAAAGDPVLLRSAGRTAADRVDEVLEREGVERIEQVFTVEVGRPERPRMPDFQALPFARQAQSKSAAATAGLPYTVYFGNLHTQSNDSDGGGALASCTSSQAAQTGAFGPADGFTYSKGRGLDITAATEHNHYFDGSSNTNTAASPTTARNRYQAGLTAAANFNAANPGYLAVYGMEWGVISNGGHLNIFNSNELLAWEYNSSNQLIGDTFVAKNDYNALYNLMNTKGWVGQFNHPSTSTQFIVNGTDLGYTAAGDAVMVLAEILNTSAFSNNTTETETGRSTYEAAFNKILERGFHVAPATNQDNHCANWGASYTNRTGVLIPNGTALSMTSFVDALRARRVYATMDKTSQLVLTANGRVMGERFANAGPLTLTANYASTSGRTASTVAIYEGVPGRNGTVTLLSSTAVTTTTPANGEHFYYAKITQDDGKLLWSAPIWVTQGGSSDTTAPTVSASESGTSGTITLSATASDNVGVARVEFYVDNVLKGTDTSSPYSMTLDSTTLTNASHALTARAYDAANNVGTSAAVNFTISNPVADTTAPTVSASESGTSGTITLSATASDNVGVARVEFYVDNVLKGTDTSSPYSMTLDSTTLTNASHALTARAYDAANNVGTSAAVNFTISNPVSTTYTEVESNGTVASANTVARSYTRITGTMGNTTDKDYFTLSLNANETLKIDMTGPTGVDYDLYLVDAADATLRSSTGSSATETLTYVNGASARTVYAKVIAYSGSSTTVPYNLVLTYTAGATATELLLNPGFESGATNWTASSGVIDNSTTQAARTGSWKAWMNGYGSAHTDTMYQQVAIPSTGTTVTLSFWLKVVSSETTTTTAYDTLKVQLRNTSGTVLTTLATYSNLNKGSTYVQKSFNVTAYKGQTVRVYFEGIEGSTVATSFLVDDASLKSQ